MTVQNIFDFLNQKFPTCTACDFDNVGILVGDKDAVVKRALIALDCTSITVDEAVENGCNLIITHHPVIFNPLKNVLKDSIVYKLIENGISVISMHTNLDIAEGGVTENLCATLNPKTLETVTASDGFTLKKCTVSPILSDDLADLLKTRLGGSVKYVPCDKPIEKILFCSGTGGGFIDDAKRFNCDALVTADVKHSQFLLAQHYGIALFDAGHFNTEDVVIEPLKDLLTTKFDIEFLTTHTSLIKSR